jgi:hypothetical protein
MAEERSYTGHAISLDFKDGQLADVFRLFADISGLNVVVNPGIRGKVTLRFNEIPWDQALDLILMANGLTYLLEGNVLRIGRISDFIQEEVRRMELTRVRSGQLPSEGSRNVVQHFHGEVNVMKQNISGPVEQAIQAQTLQGSPVNRLSANRITDSLKVVASSGASPELQEALVELHAAVATVVKDVPVEYGEAADEAVNLVEVIARQATERRPVKEVLQAAGLRLIEVAKGLNATVQLPSTLAKIAALLGLSGLF